MFYKYLIKYCNEYDGTEPTDCGVVWANSYGNAADKVVEDYGPSNIIDITLSELFLGEDGEGNCLNKEEIDYAFKE